MAEHRFEIWLSSDCSIICKSTNNDERSFDLYPRSALQICVVVIVTACAVFNLSLWNHEPPPLLIQFSVWYRNNVDKLIVDLCTFKIKSLTILILSFAHWALRSEQQPVHNISIDMCRYLSLSVRSAWLPVVTTLRLQYTSISFRYYVSEIVSIIVGVLFAFQTDDKENSYHVTRGESFYLQVGFALSYKKINKIQYPRNYEYLRCVYVWSRIGVN